MSSLSIEKSFIENYDYLMELAKIVSNTSVKDMDSNLVYEIAYARTYLEVILEGESFIEDKWVEDCLTAFDKVLDNVNYETLKKQVSVKDYKNLLKAKYDKVEDGSYKRSYEIIPSPLIFYIENNIGKIITMFASIIASLVIVANKETAFANYPYYVVFFLTLILSMSSICFMLIITIDILYICFPIFRMFSSNDENSSKWASTGAVNAVERAMNMVSITKKIKDYDRINRNISWLESMINCAKVYKSDFFVSLNALEKLKSEINKHKSLKSKKYYLALAKVEFLHDELIKWSNER